MYGNSFNRFAPVKVGDELDVKIEAIGEKGDGIARKEGFVLIIPGTNIGDEVRVKVTRVLRRVGFAEVIGKAERPEEEVPEDQKEEKADEESQEEETEESYDEVEDSEDFGEDLEE